MSGDRHHPADREHVYRQLVETIRDYAIFVLDAQGRIETWNAGAQLIKGYRADEVLGCHFSIFYTPEDVAAGRPQLLLETAASAGRVEETGWRVRRDGSRFWADVVITVLRDSSGVLIGYAKVTRDLTERLQLEEERVRAARAEESLRIRDEFLAIVSHELRTPLTSMLLGLDGVQERLLRSDGALASRLARVVRSGQRLALLIENLLDVSRVSAGRFVPAPEQVDIGELVARVCEGLRPAAARAGCEVEARIPEGITGTWDRVGLEQVVSNLLDNAIKFGAGQPVEVTVAGDAQRVCIEVADRGPGVDQEDLQRIFERFERAASIRNHGGLGLGLYIAERIIDAHGGTLRASRRDGGGANFLVGLPRSIPVATPKQEAS